MAIEVISFNHAGLVVRSAEAAERFYTGVLGFERHHRVPSWLVVNQSMCLHLIEIPEATIDRDNLYHAVNHLALQVGELGSVLAALLEHNRAPFQMDFEGTERPITDKSDPLTFGIGTLFVRDDDDNLLEFIEEGRGLFTSDMRPLIR